MRLRVDVTAGFTAVDQTLECVSSVDRSGTVGDLSAGAEHDGVLGKYPSLPLFGLAVAACRLVLQHWGAGGMASWGFGERAGAFKHGAARRIDHR